MRIVLGVLAADRGEVLFDGRPVTSTTRARFGYMPEERGLYPKMRVRDQLVYFARLHGIGAAAARPAADRWIERLGLSERAGDRVETLSLGNQQRVQLAAALVHDPGAAGARRAVLRPRPGRRRRAERRARRVRRDRRAGGLLLAPARARRAPVRRRRDHQGRPAGGVRAGRGAARPRHRRRGTCASTVEATRATAGSPACRAPRSSRTARPRGRWSRSTTALPRGGARRRPRRRHRHPTSASSGRRWRTCSARRWRRERPRGGRARRARELRERVAGEVVPDLDRGQHRDHRRGDRRSPRSLGGGDTTYKVAGDPALIAARRRAAAERHRRADRGESTPPRRRARRSRTASIDAAVRTARIVAKDEAVRDDLVRDCLQRRAAARRRRGGRRRCRVATIEPVDEDADAKSGYTFFIVLILYGQLLTYGYWVAAGRRGGEGLARRRGRAVDDPARAPAGREGDRARAARARQPAADRGGRVGDGRGDGARSTSTATS